jgi:hypothetical protein
MSTEVRRMDAEPVVHRSGTDDGMMLMLRRDEVVEDRLFAHPDHVTADKATMCMLIRDVARRLRAATGPFEVWEPSPDQWYRHVLVPRPEAFSRYTSLYVVGFFGRKRESVALEVARSIQDLSAELERRIHDFPGVLSYSTHLLADEHNYANLVMLDSANTIETWRTIRPHPVAAGRVSVDYYAYVRIYHGEIEVSQMETEGAVRLRLVKYWDYRSDPVWMAQRRLTPA